MRKWIFVFALLPSLAFAWSTSEVKNLLGDYPRAGSAELQRDFDILFNYQNIRTTEQCEFAQSEESASFSKFFAKSGLLSSAELAQLKGRMTKVSMQLLSDIEFAKNVYKRPRPFLYNNDITPCLREPDGYAFPSGHATSSRVFALLLSKLYPERKESFLKRADEVAENRVLGGVHHPSDIEAGKKFADAIAEKIQF